MPAYRLDEAALEVPDVAVVGVAARLPGANDVWSYWENLREGREAIVPLSDETLISAGVAPALLKDPNYVKAAAPLDRLDQFDRKLFGLSELEARVMDPQHRHFLEVCFEALESAGIDPARFKGSIGVFGGSGMNAYLPYNLFTNPALMRQQGLFLIRHTGNDKDFLTTRASYCLDLRGPSVNIQTACSTSLVAIHAACQSLLAGECDAALAGGVTIELPHHHGYRYEEGEILSPDGHCRPFEARSKGTVFGSGCGVVVLKRLRDAAAAGDTIWALVKGSAVNNDGSRKAGYLAPSVDGQAECVVEALQVSGLHPQDVSYIECHGTGTPVGDPIELTALTDAFRRSTTGVGFCGVGSVKSNLGHLDTAAGVASFIKVVQMLRHEVQAKTLHFEHANPQIDFAASPFVVVAQNRPWPRTTTPRRGGVSSLGVGGTNAHVIVEEAPLRVPAPPARPGPQLLFFSARSDRSVREHAERIVKHAAAHALELSEVSSTLLQGRARFAHRRAIAASSWAEAAAVLEGKDERRVVDVTHGGRPREVVFLFPGGGAQYVGMARALAQTQPVFEKKLDECLAVLAKLGVSIAPLLLEEASPATERALERPALGLPALLAAELAWAECLGSMGVTPVAMLGHSLGEYAAAHLAGVLTLEDALAIVCTRGRLFETVEKGGMLAVSATRVALEPLLPPGVSIGVVNGPSMVVASGTNAGIDALAAALTKREVEFSRLHIDVAAHSPLLDPILPEFERSLAHVRFAAPRKAWLSNRTGTWAADTAPTAKDFVRHLREPVRFADNLAAIFERHPDAVLLEVGPGQMLASVARAHPGRPPKQPIASTSCHVRDRGQEAVHWVTTVGRLIAHDVPLELGALVPERRIVPLPPTPFEHERHWVEPGAGYFAAAGATDEGAREDDPARWFFAPAFRELGAPSLEPARGERWLCVVDEGPLAVALGHEVRARGAEPLFVHPGPRFERRADGAFTAALADPESVAALWAGLGEAPRRVVHALALSPHVGREATPAALDRAFFSLFALARVLSQEELTRLRLCVGTVRALETPGAPVVNPVGALVRGPVLVVPREQPELEARWVDLLDTATPEATARALVEEAVAQGQHAVVARRGAARLVEQLDRVAVPEAQSSGLTAPRVLVTGGLGGMGLAFASSLGAGAKVTLLSRSPVPDAKIDPAEARAKALRELEAKGVSVEVVVADVTDAALVARVVGEKGPFDVVLHAAGVLDDGPLALKTVASASAVLAPKVHGSLAVVAALRAAPPKHLVLVSSTSAWLGPPGQIDYTAANAFVGALAASLAPQWQETHVVALCSGVWRESGMAVRAASGAHPAPRGQAAEHPWLQTRRVEGGATVFESTLSPGGAWVLDQHRVRGGSAVMPGTGTLELARAVGGHALDAAVEVHDLVFSSPLQVADGTTRLLRATARADGEFVLESRGRGDRAFVEHARATVRRATTTRPPPVPVADLEARCHVSVATFEEGAQVLPQDRELAFGPQWKVLRTMRFAEREAVARLEVPPVLRGELGGVGLHPGLMDIATGFAFSLADGAGTAGKVRVPLSYHRVTCFEPLPASVVSWVRLRSTGSEDVAVFDATLATPEGRVLVELEGYTTRAVPPELLRLTIRTEPGAPSPLDAALESGFSDAEGVTMLDRVIRSRLGPQVTATPVSIYALLDQLNARPAPVEAPPKGPAPVDGAPPSDAPRDDVERKLAELWQALLGVERVGIRSNFFELGGHSLIAVRLFTRLKKAYGIDLPLSVLFDAPTIESCAEIVRKALGITFVEQKAEAVAAPPVATAPAKWSPLVAIQRGTGVPFFCVHGAGGNVMNLRPLAVGLGSEQGFWGLQAVGTDGREPLSRIEDMAALYLSAVRELRPRGPYLLGGYSGGGVVAYEMAQRLRAAGESVALLALLDTFKPGQPPKQPSFADRFARLLEEGPASLPRRARTRLARHLNDLSVELRMRQHLAEETPMPLDLRDLRLTRAFLEAADRYAVQPYTGPVTLFRAREIADVFRYVGPQLGWGPLIPQLKIVEVPGNHDTLVLEPNVQVLTRALATALKDAAMGAS